MRKTLWKCLLILGILTLLTFVCCSKRPARAQYQPQPTSSQRSSDFCNEEDVPAEGEKLEIKPCPPIDCDLVWHPERCVNVTR